MQGEPQNINLWVNSIVSAIDPTKINGVLLILENISRDKLDKSLANLVL
ncbi:hypothetical protein [Microcoleus sp. POL10_C6]